MTTKRYNVYKRFGWWAVEPVGSNVPVAEFRIKKDEVNDASRSVRAEGGQVTVHDSGGLYE